MSLSRLLEWISGWSEEGAQRLRFVLDFWYATIAADAARSKVGILKFSVHLAQRSASRAVAPAWRLLRMPPSADRRDVVCLKSCSRDRTEQRLGKLKRLKGLSPCTKAETEQG